MKIMSEKKKKNEERAIRGIDKENKGFEQKILDLARVTRVTKGGKRLRFRAAVAIGDKKGHIGFAIAKGADVTMAINKAVRLAEKNLIEIPIVNNTIPFQIEEKFKSARVLIKPAQEGKGVIAGGVMRSIFELSGVPNVVAKIISRTTNKLTIAYAVMSAIEKLNKYQEIKFKHKKESKK